MIKLRNNRRGLALPFTLFLVTMITLLLAMAFSRTAAEVQISNSSDDAVTAHAVAQGGLYAYLADSFTVRPAPGDSFRYNVIGGYAWVVPEELQKPADTTLNDIVYLIRSTATVIDPLVGTAPQAMRSIMQLARWHTPPAIPSVTALITAANGITRPSASPSWLSMMAFDQCGFGAPLSEMLTRDLGLPTPHLDDSTGTGAVSDPSAINIAAASNVDWALVTGGTFTGDYNTILLDDATYSTQFIIGDASISMPYNGTGVLIVTGNLFITGSGSSGNDVTWDGVILVGGYVSSTASFFTLNGIMVTGLNETLLPPPSPIMANIMGGHNNDTRLLYNSCEVQKATARLRGFIPIPGTMIDNWASY